MGLVPVLRGLRGQRLSRALLGRSGLQVSPEDKGSVCFVYVFDVEARRLDAFATHAAAKGERLGPVTFAHDGAPDRPALDLLPEELFVDPPLPGPELSAEALGEMLDALPALAGGSISLQWVSVSEEPDRSLAVVLRAIGIAPSTRSAG